MSRDTWDRVPKSTIHVGSAGGQLPQVGQQQQKNVMRSSEELQDLNNLPSSSILVPAGNTRAIKCDLVICTPDLTSLDALTVQVCIISHVQGLV